MPQSEVERNALSAVYYPATAGLFTTLHVPLLRGRDLPRGTRLRRRGWRSSIRPWLARSGPMPKIPIGKQLTLDLVPEERAAPNRRNRRRRQSEPPSNQAGAGDVRTARPKTGALSRTLPVDAHLHVVSDSPDGGREHRDIPAVRKAMAEIDPTRPIGKFSNYGRGSGRTGARTALLYAVAEYLRGSRHLARDGWDLWRYWRIRWRS